jgi:16S rRNA (cytosine967-C5)-methyltransferase
VSGAEGWRDGAGGIRTRPDLWPDLGGLDGFHMARLERGDSGAPVL